MNNYYFETTTVDEKIEKDGKIYKVVYKNGKLFAEETEYYLVPALIPMEKMGNYRNLGWK